MVLAQADACASTGDVVDTKTLARASARASVSTLPTTNWGERPLVPVWFDRFSIINQNYSHEQKI